VLDLGGYEGAPDPRRRMLIFCHPQNPTGRAFSRAELEGVADFVIRHDLIVVSDEIHADIVYSDNKHIPLASLHPEIAARTITITSATKSFNIPALRCAVMHFGAPALKDRFGRRIPSRLLGSPGVTGVDATVAAWDDGQPWLDEILAQLRANRDWLAATLATELPAVTMRVPEATKGFGFIAADRGGKDIFVHASALERAGIPGLTEGQRVSVDVIDGRKGPEAAGLRLT
jgi:cystathionine beta-lyase